VETIIEKLRRYTEMNPGAAILFDDAHSKGITYAQLDDMSARVCGWLKARKTADAFVLYQRENRWKRSVQHGLLTARTSFYDFLVFSSFDGADHCTDHLTPVFICEGGEIKLKDIIVGHVEGNGLCIHT